MDTATKHSEQAYTHADKAIGHYQRLLAGALSPAQRRAARLALIRAVLQRAAALQAMETEYEVELVI